MSNTTFNFDKVLTKEVTIAGKLHILEFNDEQSVKFQMAVVNFRDNHDALKKKNDETDYMKVSKEELQELNDLQTGIAKDFITEVLGEDEYERLYEKSGKCTKNLMGVIHFLVEVIDDVNKDAIEDARLKYLSNNKA